MSYMHGETAIVHKKNKKNKKRNITDLGTHMAAVSVGRIVPPYAESVTLHPEVYPRGQMPGE